MKTIYLVRHGETEANRQGVLQGWNNNPLDTAGHKQAEGLVLRASRVPLETIYVSDLIRTQETAAPLARARGMEPVILPGLREISFGRWEGLTFSQLRREEPELLECIFITPTKADVEAPETLEASQERGWAALTQITRDLEEDKNCLVVCHGALIRLLLCRILSMPIDAMWRLSLDNTASCKVVYTQEFGYRVETMNALGFL